MRMGALLGGRSGLHIKFYASALFSSQLAVSSTPASGLEWACADSLFGRWETNTRSGEPRAGG